MGPRWVVNSHFAFMGIALRIPRVASPVTCGFAIVVGLRFVPVASCQPPVRNTAHPIASAPEAVGRNLGLKEMVDGRLLYNDADHRRLLLFDPALSTYRIVADTTGLHGFKYGDAAAQLIPYLGDSSLFVDFASRSLLVLDCSGSVARVMAPPKLAK